VGCPIGNLRTEPFAVLKFKAKKTGISSIYMREGRSSIVTVPVSSLSQKDLYFEHQVIKVLVPGATGNCNGADLDYNGKVEINDLQKFISDMKSDCKNIKSLYVLWILNELDKSNGLRNCNPGNKLCNLLDINSNGILNSLDALLLLNALDSCSSGNPGMNTASDLNDDGYVNDIDRNLLLGKLNQFPVGIVC